MTATARRNCGTRAQELREEANSLRESPFNRLSFHSVNDRACVVWRIPTVPADLPKHVASSLALDLGESMADELFAALDESIARGVEQSHMGYLIAKVVQKIENRSMLIGFTRAIDDGFNALIARTMSPGERPRHASRASA